MSILKSSHVKSSHLNCEGCRSGGHLFIANILSACSGLLKAWQIKRKEHTNIAVEALPSYPTKTKRQTYLCSCNLIILINSGYADLIQDIQCIIVSISKKQTSLDVTIYWGEERSRHDESSLYMNTLITFFWNVYSKLSPYKNKIINTGTNTTNKKRHFWNVQYCNQYSYSPT